ncbi:MAG: hypothetical protein COS88_06145, partial [Chloroflexi bacterium CG07_land_8_20_14_0_80_51_10]
MKKAKFESRSGILSDRGGQKPMEGITFSEALEIIESLPEEQRETLIQIVQHRLIEQRRER